MRHDWRALGCEPPARNLHHRTRPPSNTLVSRLVDARLQVGRAPEGAPRVARDGLLREEAGGGDHGEARMRQLLLLHERELLRVLGREAERVKAQVAREVL